MSIRLLPVNIVNELLVVEVVVNDVKVVVSKLLMVMIAMHLLWAMWSMMTKN